MRSRRLLTWLVLGLLAVMMVQGTPGSAAEGEFTVEYAGGSDRGVPGAACHGSVAGASYDSPAERARQILLDGPVGPSTPVPGGYCFRSGAGDWTGIWDTNRATIIIDDFNVHPVGGTAAALYSSPSGRHWTSPTAFCGTIGFLVHPSSADSLVGLDAFVTADSPWSSDGGCSGNGNIGRGLALNGTITLRLSN